MIALKAIRLASGAVLVLAVGFLSGLALNGRITWTGFGVALMVLGVAVLHGLAGGTE